MMEQIKFNLNDPVKVKLTPKGRNILVKRHNRFIITTKEEVKKMHPVDDEGYTVFQLWNLMQIFGEHIYMGDTNPPFEMNIIIVTKDDKDSYNHKPVGPVIITDDKEPKFAGFNIYEDGESRKLSFKEIEEFEKQGYEVELRLIRKEKVKIMSMAFETENKKESK